MITTPDFLENDNEVELAISCTQFRDLDLELSFVNPDDNQPYAWPDSTFNMQVRSDNGDLLFGLSTGNGITLTDDDTTIHLEKPASEMVFAPGVYYYDLIETTPLEAVEGRAKGPFIIKPGITTVS
ncbi:hypothetical protein ACFPMF_01790 [Larkinella bovis]|uniref:Uncharacterized protein n=1 Tax=Larkinella bovis TaxID=683041 RepID=A0ABW0I5Z2_9BACT